MPKQLVSHYLSTLSQEQKQHNTTLRSTADPCWAPPIFPETGRLNLTVEQIRRNYEKLIDKEQQYRSDAKSNQRSACCKTLHVSLFFDGTNNNDKNDTEDASPPHPSNVAKLLHACAPNNDEAMSAGFYSYYMPGVGTPFPEIGTDEYYSDGLVFATGGEARISWALVQICNAIHHATTTEELDPFLMRTTVEKMSSDLNFDTINTKDTAKFTASAAIAAIIGPYSGLIGGAYSYLSKEYTPLEPLHQLIEQHGDLIRFSRPKAIALKLYVYGFSRGAAEARTFVHWVDKLLAYHAQKFNAHSQISAPLGTLFGMPVSVEFLGLFDTVAAVGIANTTPMASGHNGWAHGTQQLPKSSLIKNTCHLVAAHEQRQAFTVDSIRTPEGNYPPNTMEVIYPGMHSDVGGGYPTKDQGKACGGNQELLSQIALHDMYAAAIDAGAPLAIKPDRFNQLPELMQRYPFRVMSDDSLEEFDLTKDLVNKFNAWRDYTLPEYVPVTDQHNRQCFTPPRFERSDLEYAMELQLVLITAWRIARYATPQWHNFNLTQQAFFQNATQHEKISVEPYHADFPKQASVALAEQFAETESKIKKIADEREDAKIKSGNAKSFTASGDLIGPPAFDANNARGQLWEGSLEFKADFEGTPRPEPLLDFGILSKEECQVSLEQTQASIEKSYKYAHYDDHDFERTENARNMALRAVENNCQDAPKYSFPSSVKRMSIGLQVLKYLDNYAYLMTDQNEQLECLSLKTIASAIYAKVIFPHLNGDKLDPLLAKVISLFDDQVHDSRAWFMHSESGVREPFSGYFLSRMIYFGDKANKSLQLVVKHKTVYGYKGPISNVGFAYLPMTGLTLINLEANKQLEIDTSARPESTYYFTRDLIPLTQEYKQQLHENDMEVLRKIAASN